MLHVAHSPWLDEAAALGIWASAASTAVEAAALGVWAAAASKGMSVNVLSSLGIMVNWACCDPFTDCGLLSWASDGRGWAV